MQQLKDPFLSPCIDVCQLNPDKSLCLGCLRTIDEISHWQSLSPQNRIKVMSQLPQRRASTALTYFKDSTQHVCSVVSEIKKIVSLVPSITQTLLDLGLGSNLVGQTVFCPTHSGFQNRPIGGTKKINWDRYDSIEKDLVFACKEENTQEIVARIRTQTPIYVFDILNLNDSLKMIQTIALLTDTVAQAHLLVADFLKRAPSLHNIMQGYSYAYFVWKNPYMVAASNTFIDSWFDYLGLRNHFADLQRYPIIDWDSFTQKPADILFLPDEPYRFSPQEVIDLKKQLPQTRVLTIEGKYPTWFGSTMVQALDYFPELLKEFIS